MEEDGLSDDQVCAAMHPLVLRTQQSDLSLNCLAKFQLYTERYWWEYEFRIFQKKERRLQHAAKETEFLRLKRCKLDASDFEALKVIGRGAFGEVYFQWIFL